VREERRGEERRGEERGGNIQFWREVCFIKGVNNLAHAHTHTHTFIHRCSVGQNNSFSESLKENVAMCRVLREVTKLPDLTVFISVTKL
jgi:hypothetical protein